MRLRNAWVGILGMSLAATIACGGGGGDTKPADAIPAPAAGATKVDPATAGSVKGTIAFEGIETYAGGTGRFADASGTSFLEGHASAVTLTGFYVTLGTLSY